MLSCFGILGIRLVKFFPQGREGYFQALSATFFDGMDRYVFWKLGHTQGKIVCSDDNNDYYQIKVLGCDIMYMKARTRRASRRFKLTDELARLLGFIHLGELRWRFPKMCRYKYVSLQALKENLLNQTKTSQFFYTWSLGRLARK